MKFTPGVQEWFNITKSMNITYNINQVWRENDRIISIDTE